MKTIILIAALFALASSASASAAGSTPEASPCLPGYQWYPEERNCIRNSLTTAATPMAEVAKCTPGEVRRVPHPTNPKKFKVQTCGNAPASADGETAEN